MNCLEAFCIGDFYLTPFIENYVIYFYQFGHVNDYCKLLFIIQHYIIRLLSSFLLWLLRVFFHLLLFSFYIIFLLWVFKILGTSLLSDILRLRCFIYLLSQS